MKAFEQQLENFKIKIKSFLRKAISTKHKVVFTEYTLAQIAPKGCTSSLLLMEFQALLDGDDNWMGDDLGNFPCWVIGDK